MSMEMPVTTMRVMLPDGKEIAAYKEIDVKALHVQGLKFGAIRLEGAEIWAVRQLLNTMYGG